MLTVPQRLWNISCFPRLVEKNVKLLTSYARFMPSQMSNYEQAWLDLQWTEDPESGDVNSVWYIRYVYISLADWLVRITNSGRYIKYQAWSFLCFTLGQRIFFHYTSISNNENSILGTRKKGMKTEISSITPVCLLQYSTNTAVISLPSTDNIYWRFNITYRSNMIPRTSRFFESQSLFWWRSIPGRGGPTVNFEDLHVTCLSDHHPRGTLPTLWWPGG